MDIRENFDEAVGNLRDVCETHGADFYGPEEGGRDMAACVVGEDTEVMLRPSGSVIYNHPPKSVEGVEEGHGIITSNYRNGDCEFWHKDDKEEGWVVCGSSRGGDGETTMVIGR